MNQKEKLPEATMKALQGKLQEKIKGSLDWIDFSDEEDMIHHQAFFGDYTIDIYEILEEDDEENAGKFWLTFLIEDTEDYVYEKMFDSVKEAKKAANEYLGL